MTNILHRAASSPENVDDLDEACSFGVYDNVTDDLNLTVYDLELDRETQRRRDSDLTEMKKNGNQNA